MSIAYDDMAAYRADLHAWLDAHEHEVAPRYDAPGTLDDQMAQMQRVKSILFDAGWMRYGWPEAVGGLGGSPMMRTELGAALAGRDIADPGLFSLIEVLAPTLIDYATPALAAEVVPALLSGAERFNSNQEAAQRFIDGDVLLRLSGGEIGKGEAGSV